MTVNEIVEKWEQQMTGKLGSAHNIPDTKRIIAAFREMRDFVHGVELSADPHGQLWRLARAILAKLDADE